jgi:hypothetical protein
MHTKHALPAGSAVILGAALALAGCAPAAAAHQCSAQIPAKPAVAPVHGTTHIVIYSVNSDGPNFRAVLSGSIGDYGPAVAVYPDGKVDPAHDSQLELDLSRGTFRLNIAELDQQFSRQVKQHYPAYPATCSDYVSFTIPVPVVAGSGTGSYRGITGDFTIGVTADEALAGASGVGEPCTQPQRRDWEVIVLAGPGTVSS